MIEPETVAFDDPVCLVGGGAVAPIQLRDALALAPRLIAADGGANVALAEGLVPELVIGDLDSILPEVRARLPADRLVHVAEQVTTDFEKCLSRINAPYVLGLGFLGPRIDHTLAVFGAMSRLAGRNCILLGEEDLIFVCPPQIDLALSAGTRVSLFPMAPVGGQSRGLRWPIDGLAFAPTGLGGTSNEATGPVTLAIEAPSMLVILPVERLSVVISALAATRRWPERGLRSAHDR